MLLDICEIALIEASVGFGYNVEIKVRSYILTHSYWKVGLSVCKLMELLSFVSYNLEFERVCVFPNPLKGDIRVREGHNFIYLLQGMVFLLLEVSLDHMRTTFSIAIRNRTIDSLNIPVAGVIH